ncbi:MAG: transporter [Bacteroidetes bacterium 43-16]|nr:MAG: transporter [Bacteroidetes bacterium 43-16]
MKTQIAIAAMILFSFGMANAQTELALKDAVDYALKHKVDAVKAGLDIQNADHKIAEVRANALPQLNGQSGLTYNAKLQQMALDFGGQTQVIRMGTPWQANSAIQLDQQIFNMAVFQGLKAAKSTKEFYILNAALTEEQIVEKVANSYYEVFKTKSQIKTMDRTIQNTTRVRNVIASLEENGLAKKIDLDRINVTLNNLNSSKVQLNNALKLQENALKYLIGMDIATPITLPESTFESPKNMYVKDEFNINSRTEIQLLERQGDLLRLNKKATEAARYPSLALSANYGYLSLGDRFPYFAGPEKGVNGSDFSAISLTLKVPIFSGFATRSRIRQAQVDIDKFEADLADTKLALDLAVENAYTQINNSVITLNSQQSNMELAQQVLDNVENNYKNGLASLTDLLDAENSFADAQNNHTAALMDYKLAEVQLKKANGELKTFYSNKQ